MNFKRFTKLIKRFNSPLIIVDPSTEDEFVLMSLANYEDILQSGANMSVNTDQLASHSEESFEEESEPERPPQVSLDESEPIPGLATELVDISGVGGEAEPAQTSQQSV